MSKKTIIIVGILLIVSFVAYSIFWKGNAQAPAGTLVSSKAVNAATGEAQVGGSILAALSSLSNLKLDTSFFNDPVFLKLKNFTRPLPDEPVGRDNPFASIGSGGGSSNVSSGTTVNTITVNTQATSTTR